MTSPLLALLGLTACAQAPQDEPKVDLNGHTKAQYEYDLDVCQQNASQLDIMKGVVIGGVGGAAGGAGIGALTGDAGHGALVGMGAGLIAGAVGGSLYGSGALTDTNPHAAEIRQCLAQRGYTVLDAPPAPSSAPASATPAGGASK